MSLLLQPSKFQKEKYFVGFMGADGTGHWRNLSDGWPCTGVCVYKEFFNSVSDELHVQYTFILCTKYS